MFCNIYYAKKYEQTVNNLQKNTICCVERGGKIAYFALCAFLAFANITRCAYIFLAAHMIYQKPFAREVENQMCAEKRAFSEANKMGILEVLFRYFTEPVVREMKKIEASLFCTEHIEEIRLRRDKHIFVTVGGRGIKRNVSLPYVVSEKELCTIFNRMCDGSLYAYSESIIRGYISLPCGVRVGVCGHASVEGGRIIGVYDIAGLNVRIPRIDIGVDESLLRKVVSHAKRGLGTLIFSPPAQGKTTCLRAIAYELSSRELMRTSVIDTREELSLMPDNKRLTLDVFSGYPKAEGIRMATLFMNPEVVICDEIGSEEEALAIADAQNCGVPLIATTHGADVYSLLRRRGIMTLHRARAFGSYVRIRIGNGGLEYTVYEWEDVEACFANNRCFTDTL